MIKSLKLLFSGFIGILVNSQFKLWMKISLLNDFIRLILYTLLLTIFARKLIDSEKSFNIKSFKYKIYFKNIYSFLFLFIEIFCKAEYKVGGKVKTYMDLGSNIGLSILWCYHFNSNMSIVAFEPDEENLLYLRKNLEENVISKYKIYDIALADKVSKTKFYRINDKVQNLDSGLHLNQKIKHTVILVKTDKLSNYVHGKRISLIKMDIEGSEYLVLKDLIVSKCLLNIDEIIFESHHFDQKEIGIYTNLVASLKKYGLFSSIKTSKVTELNYWFNNHIT